MSAAMTPQALAEYVGTKIKLRRRMAGLTADQLARASALRPEQIKAIEAGQTSAAWTDLVAIARALGCDLSALVEELGQDPT